MNYIVIISEKLASDILFIGSGLPLSLALLFGALFFGLFLGTFFAIMRHNNILNRTINAFVSVIRGTPMILQISLIYFAIPSFLDIQLNVISAGVFALGLNSSAYVSEILRSGIENISKGQFEAAKTLKIPLFYTWKDIILPQVIRNILPALTNEMITLFKDTALISTIGGLDIMRKSQILSAAEFTYFMPLCIAGAYYYILVFMIEFFSKKIEKRMVC